MRVIVAGAGVMSCRIIKMLVANKHNAVGIPDDAVTIGMTTR